MHAALQPKPQPHLRALEALVVEQRRTNRLLSAVVFTALGFFLAVVALQVMARLG